MYAGRPWTMLLLTGLALLLALPAMAQEGDEPGDEGDEGSGDVEWGDDEGGSGPSMGDDGAPADDGAKPAEGGDGEPGEGAPGDGEPAEGEGEGEGSSGDPNITREDDEDVDDWDTTIEAQDLNQVVEREEVRVDVGDEPERIGISGNWYQVAVDCLYCESVLGQNLEVEEASVMRQFFDHLQLDPDFRTGKLVYPSEGINRPVYVTQDGDRVIIVMYVIDVGERTTPLYATVWDLQWMLRDKKLLYGKRFSVDAYQVFAFTSWEKGYKADEAFLPREQILTFLDLSPVASLGEDEKKFPIGEKAVLTYLGADAFVRSDFDPEPYADLQARLFKEKVELEKRETERRESMDTAIAAFDDRDYETCLASLRRAGELGENSADYHFYLGAAHQGMKNYDAAVSEYRAVLNELPKDTTTRFNLAVVLEKLGRYQDALQEYRVILKWDPDDEEAKERAFNLALQLQQ